jgi:hypothetical protein
MCLHISWSAFAYKMMALETLIFPSLNGDGLNETPYPIVADIQDGPFFERLTTVVMSEGIVRIKESVLEWLQYRNVCGRRVRTLIVGIEDGDRWFDDNSINEMVDQVLLPKTRKYSLDGFKVLLVR